MSSPNVVVRGCQRPRVLHVPEYASSSGEEAIELAAMCGLVLDPWQELVLRHALGERPDGKWAAFEVAVEVARQNGKGGILEARELAGLFLLGEQLLIHSAHEFPTAAEALERMDQILEANSDLSRRVRVLKRSHGEEGVYLKNGQRLRYRTRTGGGGRGWSADWVVMDEAMIVPERMHGALLPTLSARPNPQIWYTGSAVDQMSMEHGVVFARLRDRAIRGDDPALAYFGWSPSFDSPADIPDEAYTDPEVWAQANPALGIRITEEHVAREQRSMDPRTFAVERLGVGDWPDLSADDDPTRISRAQWAAVEDAESVPVDPVSFAFDVRPDRQASAVAVAGFRQDGLRHVEILEHKSGTGWILDFLEERMERHACGPVIFAGNSPAAGLKRKLTERGVPFEELSGPEYAEACGSFFDDVVEGQLRHRVDLALAAAVRGAARRTASDAWVWSRKNSAVDISPLVACTIARWAVTADRPSVYESRGVLTI